MVGAIAWVELVAIFKGSVLTCTTGTRGRSVVKFRPVRRGRHLRAAELRPAHFLLGAALHGCFASTSASSSRLRLLEARDVEGVVLLEVAPASDIEMHEVASHALAPSPGTGEFSEHINSNPPHHPPQASAHTATAARSAKPSPFAALRP